MLIQPNLIAPLTRGITKTGLETSYASGDDGELERGWWFGRLNANNKKRFFENEYESGEEVITDRATGLMWPKDWLSPATLNRTAVNWATALGWCLGLDYGGFEDWSLPNIKEIFSLIDLGVQSPCIDTTVFDGALAAANYWSSTSSIVDTTTAYRLLVGSGIFLTTSIKVSTNLYFVPCRKAI